MRRILRGKRDQTLVRSAEELDSGDFSLEDLTDCKVFLLGPISALRVHRLKNCSLVAGPVSGAAFFEGSCIFSCLSV